MHVKSKKTSLKEILFGLKNTIKTEFSMRLIFFVWIFMLLTSYIFCFDYFEWAITIMLLGLITATELINTSLEAVVDLISPNIHTLAKIAKDTASAATAIFSTVAFISFVSIIINKLMEVGII